MRSDFPKMDFFERQDIARRNTKLLVLYFALGVSLLIVAIYAAILLVFVWIGPRPEFGPQQTVELWNPRLFLGTAIGALSVILIGSLFKTLQLSSGGKAVATSLGGRLVEPHTTDPDERRLLNVVEEMALASGVPVPQVYVMDRELGINAFAAGHTPSDAVIGVTRGCMKLLSRDELQGVIGHEFSHILNGDMRLNLRLMGWIFGILCIAVIGRVLLETRFSNRRDKNPLPLLGILLLILGWIGVFFGRMIQAAVSRQREFLADAAAVQFTRNPSGLAGALKKIGGLAYGSKVESAHAGEASHMFFSNGLGQAMFGSLATHPPLDLRIRAIDPSFDGKFPKVDPTPEASADKERSRTGSRRVPGPFPFEMPGMPQSRGGGGISVLPPVIAAAAIVPQMGEPTTRHLQYAVELRDSFPPAVQNAAHEPLGACALIYGLVLSKEAELLARQLDLVEKHASKPVRNETARLFPAVQQLATRARLPLVDLALPALKNLSFEQFEQFNRTLTAIIESDNQIDLFEYVLQKIIVRHLMPEFRGTARKPVIQFYSPKPLAPDCAVLLSALASAGSTDLRHAQAAFQRGAAPLAQRAQTPIEFIPPEQCGLDRVDAALQRLNEASPQIKKAVLDACAITVAADGMIQETEAELLRAIGDALDCPIPPILSA
jgi:Zn-dependent protease with chaperone function